VHGSKRHLKKLSRSALTLVSEFGKPHFFVTGTTNPQWPEVIDALPAGQTCFNRIEISTMLFKRKLEHLLHNLCEGKYHGGRYPLYTAYSIEYQERGLPHFYLVYRLTDLDDSPDNAVDIIDNHISTTRPVQTDGETEKDIRYRTAVNKFMLHR
jgi:hypothetical protein